MDPFDESQYLMPYLDSQAPLSPPYIIPPSNNSLDSQTVISLSQASTPGTVPYDSQVSEHYCPLQNTAHPFDGSQTPFSIHAPSSNFQPSSPAARTPSVHHMAVSGSESYWSNQGIEDISLVRGVTRQHADLTASRANGRAKKKQTKKTKQTNGQTQTQGHYPKTFRNEEDLDLRGEGPSRRITGNTAKTLEFPVMGETQSMWQHGRGRPGPARVNFDENGTGKAVAVTCHGSTNNFGKDMMLGVLHSKTEEEQLRNAKIMSYLEESDED